MSGGDLGVAGFLGFFNGGFHFAGEAVGVDGAGVLVVDDLGVDLELIAEPGDGFRILAAWAAASTRCSCRVVIWSRTLDCSFWRAFM